MQCSGYRTHSTTPVCQCFAIEDPCEGNDHEPMHITLKFLILPNFRSYLNLWKLKSSETTVFNHWYYSRCLTLYTSVMQSGLDSIKWYKSTIPFLEKIYLLAKFCGARHFRHGLKDTFGVRIALGTHPDVAFTQLGIHFKLRSINLITFIRALWLRIRLLIGLLL